MGCNFCKEEEEENEQVKSVIEQKRRKQIPSIIKEEESHMAYSSQTNSFMRRAFDTRTEDSASIYNSNSRITSQFIRSTLKLEMSQKIVNYVTQLAMSANLQKSASLKNCYNIHFATPEEIGDYQYWKLLPNDNFFDRKSVIANGETVKIKHCLTGNYLCAKQSLLTKKYEVCTTNLFSDECYWIVDIYDKEATLKQGAMIYLIHMASKRSLSYAKQKKSLQPNQYKIVLSQQLENMKQVWRLIE